MNRDREESIRAKAYEIWEREGRSGDAQEQWLRAERELNGEPGAGHGSPDADKMAEQIQVALDARNARSKQTGRAGATGVKKAKAKSAEKA